MAEPRSTPGKAGEFLGEAAGFWREMPDKPLFFCLVIAWGLLFQLLGNSTLGYVNTPSIFRWWLWVNTRGLEGATAWEGLKRILGADEAYVWFVPFVVLGLLWWKRREFTAVTKQTWWPALGLLGVRYRYGGDTPAAGLDCSGLVRYVFQQVTGVTLPRTARELSQVGASVSLDDLQVGDLVFFNTRNYAFSHVGLYLGDNRFIHAPRRGRDVEITTLSRDYWQRHFNGARRLVGVLPSLIPGMFPEALASTLSTLSLRPVEAPAEEAPDLPGAP